MSRIHRTTSLQCSLFTIAASGHGADVVLHHLGENTLKDTEAVKQAIESNGRKAILVAGDIGDPSTAEKVSPVHPTPLWILIRCQIVTEAIKAFSRIDILISNAGICPFHTFLDMPNDLWKKVQNVNLDGSFYITRAVANQMAAQEPKGGSIVAISSISALMGGAGQTHYTPTKAGIKSLMESCAIALGPMGIRCNSILPGEYVHGCISILVLTLLQERSRQPSTSMTWRTRASAQ